MFITAEMNEICSQLYMTEIWCFYFMDMSKILMLDQFYSILSFLIVICKWAKVSKSLNESKTKQKWFLKINFQLFDVH